MNSEPDDHPASLVTEKTRLRQVPSDAEADEIESVQPPVGSPSPVVLADPGLKLFD
jgi:hypothetical protein